MHVHAAAVVADERLRHEGRRLAVAGGHVQHRVLQDLHFVGLLRQAAGAHADFALAASRDFVVMHFDLQAHLFERQTHRRADVLERIDRRHREVATLEARAVTHVADVVLLARIPRALHRVDLVERAVEARAVTDAVEDEEFVLGAEQRAIGDAGRLEVRLGTLCERARIALIALHGRRLDDVAADVDRRLFEERIEDGRGRVEHEDHVRLVDALPASDRRTVEHLAVTEQVLVERVGRRSSHAVLYRAYR